MYNIKAVPILLCMMLMCVCVQVDFYISQSQAANHAVREAACICTAELGTKVSNLRTG